MTRNWAGTGIPPGNGGVVYPSATEWPITSVAITNITQSLNAVVTAPGHGIVNSGAQDTPSVSFSQVNGMQQINGHTAFVTKIIDVNTFTIALNTLFFQPYISGGWINVLTGMPPIDPFQNTFP